MNARRLTRPIVLAAALALSACAEPPRPTVTIELTDNGQPWSRLMSLVEVFKIDLLHATHRGGETLRCDDFPTLYPQVDTPQLGSVYPTIDVPNTWSASSAAVKVAPINVPLDQPLLILVRGTAQTSHGPMPVARGCVEGFRLTEAAERRQVVDLVSATGAPCLRDAECEPPFRCRLEPKMPGGYCARSHCTGHDTCSPAARCIADLEGGGTVCLRICASDKDCFVGSAQAQACVGRLSGPGSGGCIRVCVHPSWNSVHACAAP